MKVYELLEILKDVDPNREVFVASDQEGNEYRMANCDPNMLMADQYGEWVAVHPDDYAKGDYDGWEVVEAVEIW